ncbi:MAG: riboflavin synthase [Limnochordales bacterium]|nr:riboflavin synthase [Limnochordales bacterium]
MFTGIVEEVGRIAAIVHTGQQARLRVEAGRVLEGTAIGDSIAVNGVCLTVVERTDHSFTADVSEETLRRTTLGHLTRGCPVNLERALTLQSRLGGHLVLGHVDGIGQVTATRAQGDGLRLEIAAPEALLPFIAEKGSIAVDGVSLTVAGLTSGGFWVAVIPQTARVTITNTYRPGTQVNLEVDVLARYVLRLLETGKLAHQQVQDQDKRGSLALDWERLARQGL